MRKIVLSVIAAVGLGSTALAADLPNRRTAPAPYVAPAFSWTGFYVGVNAGYAFNGDSKLKDVDVIYYGSSIGPLDSSHTSDDGSFTGGAQVGYNYQMGSIVLGAEADISYAALKQTFAGRSDFIAVGMPNNLGYAIPGASTIDAQSKVEWFGTVRARLGFSPIDRLLVFATGGLAYGQVKTNMTFTDYFNNSVDNRFTGSKSDTRFGWTLGAGVEYAVTNNITIKGEYAYVDLGDKTHTWQATTYDAFSGRAYNHTMTAKDEANFHVVRAGVNYKF